MWKTSTRKTKLLKKDKEDCRGLKDLPDTCIGRINIVKMVYLSKSYFIDKLVLTWREGMSYVSCLKAAFKMPFKKPTSYSYSQIYYIKNTALYICNKSGI
jgi:hypothetical protein